MPVLYHFPLHPHCRKIRLILDELHVSYSLHALNPWGDLLRVTQLNPYGEIPILREDDDSLITGISAVSEYLYEQSRDDILFGESMMERAQLRQLCSLFERQFEQDVSSKLLYEKVFKRYGSGGSPDTRAMRQGKANLADYLQLIETLTEEQPWLAGERMTVADLTAGAFISALDYIGDIDWSPHTKAKEWYSLLKSRPSFQKLFRDEIRGITPPPYFDNPDF